MKKKYNRIFICIILLQMILMNNVDAQGYPQCETNVNISVIVTQHATCISNGAIQITFEGSNVGNLILDGANPDQLPLVWLLPDGDGTVMQEVALTGSGTVRTLTNLKADHYTIQIKAFCQAANDYIDQYLIDTFTINNNYTSPIVSAIPTRKTMNCRPTGNIGFTFSGGTTPYNLTITQKPSTYTGQTVFSNITTTTYNIGDLPDGFYTILFEDACNTNVISNVTITSLSQDVPLQANGVTLAIFNLATWDMARPQNVNDCVSFRVYSGGNITVHPDWIYYWNHLGEYYDFAYSTDGSKPWQTHSTSNPIMTLPNGYTYQTFCASSDQLTVYIKPKGNSCSSQERSVQLNKNTYLCNTNIFDTKTLDHNGSCSSAKLQCMIDHYYGVCYPATFAVTPFANVLDTIDKGIMYGNDWSVPLSNNATSAIYDRGTRYRITVTGDDGRQYITTWTPPIGGQEFTIGWGGSVYYQNESCNTKSVSIATTGSIVPGTTIEYVSGPAPLPWGAFGGDVGSVYTIPNGYTSNRFNITDGYYSYPAGIYHFRVTNPCNNVQELSYTETYDYTYPTLTFITEQTCNGLRIYPQETVLRTHYVTQVTTPTPYTSYWIYSGPSGVIYNSAKVAPGGYLLLPTPGEYQIRVNDRETTSSAQCGVSTSFTYTSVPLSAEPSAAYVCEGNSYGNIIVKGIDGVPFQMGGAHYNYSVMAEDLSSPTVPILHTNTTGEFLGVGKEGHQYIVTISDSCGSVQVPLTMVDIQNSNIIYTPKNAYCEEEPIQLNAIALGSVTYSWTGPNGWATSGNQPQHRRPRPVATLTTPPPLIPDYGNGGNYTVSVIPLGCSAAKEGTIAITVNSDTVPTLSAISGPTYLCGSTSAIAKTYSIETVPGAANYTWTMPDGWTITGGQGTNSITVTHPSTSVPSNIIRVAVTTVCNKNAETTLNVAVGTGDPVGVPVILNENPVQACVSTDITLSVEPVSGATGYMWRFPDDWTVVSGAGTASITVHLPATAPTPIPAVNIYVSAVNECGVGQETMATVYVSVTTPPNANSITTTASTTVCADSDQITFQSLLVTPVSPGTTYQWSVPSGWDVISESTSWTDAILVAKPGASAVSGDITLRLVNSCGAGNESILSVTIATCNKLIIMDGTGADIEISIDGFVGNQVNTLTASYIFGGAGNLPTDDFNIRGNNKWYADRAMTTQITETTIIDGLTTYYTRSNVADDHATFEMLLKTYAADYPLILIRGVKNGNASSFSLSSGISLTEARTVTLQRYYADGGYIITAPGTVRHLWLYASGATFNFTFKDVQFQGLNNPVSGTVLGGGIGHGPNNSTLNLIGANTINNFSNIRYCYWNDGEGGGAGTDGTLTINGNLKISENKTGNNSTCGGGGVGTNGGVIIMNDGVISNNIANREGGGVAIYNGTFNMSGGTVCDNTALNANGGGGIYTANHKTLTIAPTAIFYGNSAPSQTLWMTTTAPDTWDAIRSVYFAQCTGRPFAGESRSVASGSDNLYNHYDINLNTYNITYNPNGGSANPPVTYKYFQSEAHTVMNNMFTPSQGYTFLGWNTNAAATLPNYTWNSGNNTFSPATINITNNTTLYAIWSYTAPTVTITYECDICAGTNSDDREHADIAVCYEVLYPSDLGFIPPIDKPVFHGWYNTELDQIWQPEDCQYVTNNVTLQAIYRSATCDNNLIGTIKVLQQPTCGNNDGKIYVDIVGGNGNYTYELYKNGIPVGTPTNNVIENLTSGNYFVIVYDADNLCSDISPTIPLINNDALTVVSKIETTEAANCTPTDDTEKGTVTATIVGDLRYTYYIYDILGNEIATGTPNSYSFTVALPSGEYYLLLSDATTCESPGGKFTIGTKTTNFDLTFNALPHNGNCNDNGYIEINITGGATATDVNHYRLNGGLWTPFVGIGVNIPVSISDHTIELKHDNCISNLRKITINSSENNAFTANWNATPTSCGTENGKITISINGQANTYHYYTDPTHSGNVSNGDFTINNLSAGIYNITITATASGTDNCDYILTLHNVEVRQGLDYGIIAPPSATTPQTFCPTATITDLQATGTGIVWYSDATAGTLLSPNTQLQNGITYYAAQTTPDDCQSADRTAVTVIINSNILIDIPNMPGIFELCAPATLADVPTYGNTNLKWYAAATGGSPLNPESIPLTLTNSPYTFYAGFIGGTTCESIQRAEVIINITDENPTAPIVEPSQTFCKGALVANLSTPNNKIVWYFEETSTTPLNANTLLIDNHTYWAAQKAGNCESNIRKPVLVTISKYPAPIAPAQQTICSMPSPATLSNLTISGSNIQWYHAVTNIGPLPLNTIITAGDKFLATQKSGICESDPVIITITAECLKPSGTVFPFVHPDNNMFVTTAKIYAIPPTTVVDKLGYTRKQTPLQTVRATYYDCTAPNPIAEVPKYPGIIGFFTNAGLPIRWNLLGFYGVPNTETAVCPEVTIGIFTFENIATGNYILEISRQGFLTRYGIINVTASTTYLGHRELLGGDVNGDLFIDGKDISTSILKECPFGHSAYEWKYDINGDKNIDNDDISIIRINLGATHIIYQETKDWINP